MKLTVRRPRIRHTAFAGVRFDEPSLLALAARLKKSGKPDKITVSDSEVSGLRAIVRATGETTFHVDYQIEGRRPYLLLGSLGERSIEDARSLARTVKGLAKKGIDPAEGLHARLWRELLEKGENWKP